MSAISSTGPPAVSIFAFAEAENLCTFTAALVSAPPEDLHAVLGSLNRFKSRSSSAELPAGPAPRARRG